MNDVDVADRSEPQPSPIELSVVTWSDPALAEAAVERLAAAFPMSRLHRETSLSAAARRDGAQIVLALTGPVEAMAWRLDQGVAVHEVLSDWIAAAASVVAETRRLRRRLWCIDARAIAAGVPDALFLPGMVPGTDMGPQDIPRPSAIALVMAERLIALDPQAARLASELAAMLLAPYSLAVDSGIVTAAQAEVSGLAEELAAARSLAAERDGEMALLREGLSLQVSQADDAASRNAALLAELAEARAALALREQDVAAARVRDAAQSAQIDDAEKALARMSAQRESLQAACLLRDTEIALLRDALLLQLGQAEEQDDARARLERALADLTDTHHALQADQRRREEENALLRNDLSGLVARFADAERSLADREARVNELMEANARLSSQEQAERAAALVHLKEIDLLREGLSLQVERAEADTHWLARLEAQAAALPDLQRATALHAAEAEALRFQLAAAERNRRTRDAQVGRALLADQAAIIGRHGRAERPKDAGPGTERSQPDKRP